MAEGKTADELETMIVTELTNYPCSSAIRVNVLPSENGDELPNWEYTLAFTGPRKAGDTIGAIRAVAAIRAQCPRLLTDD